MKSNKHLFITIVVNLLFFFGRNIIRPIQVLFTIVTFLPQTHFKKVPKEISFIAKYKVDLLFKQKNNKTVNARELHGVGNECAELIIMVLDVVKKDNKHAKKALGSTHNKCNKQLTDKVSPASLFFTVLVLYVTHPRKP